ncbi:MAG TPA: serine/threonine-protein kinase [Gaiellaceae bacterium]|jgi:serine/threonine-protein kinase
MPARTDIPLPARYRDAQLLAHGGMGEVYRATDAELGREVAVKVLAARFAEDDGIRRRFRREALAAARLSSNPHIVTIFDVGEHEGRPLIVMELLAGGSLERRVAGRTPCPRAQVLDWLDDAAAALDAAHAAGVVHRDVKPGNLLLDDAGHVKVADFGIASAAGLDSFTQTGTILGTAGYLAPEQARGERAGPASDRYGLAVVAWELLAGRRPFEAPTPTAEAMAHISAPVPSISAASASLPRSLDAVFAKALAKDPARRQATAAELVRDLRSALREETETWVQPAPRPARAASAPRGRTRSRRWLVVPAAVVVAAAGAAAALLLSHHSATTASGPTTIVRTVTGAGTTVEQTVTAPAPPPPSSPSSTPASTASSSPAPVTTGSPSGAALNDSGYAKMRAGDFAGALPLVEQAVAKLRGSGSLDEAYADFNLAFTRFALGRCDDVAALLDRSEQLQGRRKEIDKLRRDVRKRC